MSLEEFKANIDGLIRKYPELAEKSLLKSGRSIQKLAKENAPVGRGKSKKLKDSFRVRLEGSSLEKLEVTVRSTSPHFHLVENGHRIVYKGKERGFKQGSHFFSKMVEQNIHKVKEDERKFFYKAINKALKDGR